MHSRSGEILALLPSYVARIVAGETPAAARPVDGVPAARVGGAARGGAIAVIPVYGVIDYRDSWLLEMFGGTSVQGLRRNLRAAMADESVKAIVLDADSPGGGVGGLVEIAGAMLAMRERKPIVAVANPMMASAAYWIGSQASEIFVTPSGEAGSIGVVTVHMDYSAALAAEGVTATVMTAGKYKAEGNPFEPLGADAKAALQARLDSYYSAFVGAVARGRGVEASAVRSGYGEGRMLGAKEAKAAGLADHIGTIEDAIARLGGASTSGAAAALWRTKLAVAGAPVVGSR